MAILKGDLKDYNTKETIEAGLFYTLYIPLYKGAELDDIVDPITGECIILDGLDDRFSYIDKDILFNGMVTRAGSIIREQGGRIREFNEFVFELPEIYEPLTGRIIKIS